MSDEFKVGVFSPNDPRPWVRSDNLEMMLTCERPLARPIMKGRVPVSDDVLTDALPGNNLAFPFGDWTAALAELAHQLDIGYRIFDRRGREYSKPSQARG